VHNYFQPVHESWFAPASADSPDPIFHLAECTFDRIRVQWNPDFVLKPEIKGAWLISVDNQVLVWRRIVVIEHIETGPKVCKHQENTTIFAHWEGPAMEIYDVEALRVKQRDVMEKICGYVSGAALKKDLYSVEKDLFRYVLRLGHAFLCEAIARHGTGKVAGPINVGEDKLPYHMDKETTYQSVFGEVKINRAYYWSKGEEGICPLDAELNLPERRYSYLLDQWVQGLIVEMPYDKSVAKFAELLDIPVTKLGQQNVAREVGSYFTEFYRQKPVFDPVSEGSIIGVQADGKGVRMIASEKPQAVKDPKPRRGKGDKSGGLRRMAVTIADFTFNPGPRSPEEMWRCS